MEDLGLSEEEAYQHVEAEQARRDAAPSSPDVTHLSLQWARLTEASIREAMREVADAKGEQPPNWNPASGTFGSVQPGASVLVRSVGADETSDFGAGASSSSGTRASDLGAEPDRGRSADEMDDETREVVDYARKVLTAKVGRLEAELDELLATSDEEGPSRVEHAVEFLEQVHASGAHLPEEILDLKVDATSGGS